MGTMMAFDFGRYAEEIGFGWHGPGHHCRNRPVIVAHLVARRHRQSHSAIEHNANVYT
jgi:hypothetical protein